MRIPQSIFFGFVLISASFILCCRDNNIEEKEKPNILWIVTEDNSKHYLRLYEEDGAPMPNVENLASQGVTFNNAFSNAPVCSVARSTIISGCYANRTGTQYHRKMEKVPMPEGLKMFPYYLKKAGYYTSNNAKEDYNFITSENTWDESSRKASYKKREKNQPFFHVQNFGTTHEGRLHFGRQELNNATITPKSDIPLPPYFPDTEIFRYTSAFYRDLHMKVDKQIGDFLKDLKEDGLMENTIIFYYGDHGGVLPRSKGYIYESGLNVPMVVYVPKKFKSLFPFHAGDKSDVFIQFVDLAPTVLNLAGVPIPDEIDGKAFLGYGINKLEIEKRDITYGYADRFDEKYEMVRSVRKGDFKYIRNYQPFNIDALFNFYRYKMLAWQEWQELFEEGKLSPVQSHFFMKRQPEELYDINNDPHETKNLANDSQYQKILSELRLENNQHLSSLPDLSFFPESYFLENGRNNPEEFGLKNKVNIEHLIDVADLQMKSFNDAEKAITKALKSADPWARYWGLIVCSSFEMEAAKFKTLARNILFNDEENLVKLRAAEFLCLINEFVKNDTFLGLLKDAKSESEANLILNSIALLKSLDKEWNIQIPIIIFNKAWVDQENDLVKRRLDFINR